MMMLALPCPLTPTSHPQVGRNLLPSFAGFTLGLQSLSGIFLLKKKIVFGESSWHRILSYRLLVYLSSLKRSLSLPVLRATNSQNRTEAFGSQWVLGFGFWVSHTSAW